MLKLSGLSRGVEDRTGSRTKRTGAIERCAGGFGWPWTCRRRIAAESVSQEAETYVRRRPQTDCCGSARALGEMEAGSA